MSVTETDRERQMREAEELLGTEKTRSFAKGLFFGRFEPDLLFPYPALDPARQAELDSYIQRVREFFDQKVDSYTIDKESRIPDEVMAGLFDLGIMTMSIPKEYGGMGLSQQAYCRVIQEVGARDGVKLEDEVWVSANGPVVLSKYPYDSKLLG